MSGDNKEPVIISSNIIDDENENFEFIPISGDDLSNNDVKVPEVLPILTLKNTVLFPGVIIPITVGRDKSIKLIKEFEYCILFFRSYYYNSDWKLLYYFCRLRQ